MPNNNLNMMAINMQHAISSRNDRVNMLGHRCQEIRRKISVVENSRQRNAEESLLMNIDPRQRTNYLIAPWLVLSAFVMDLIFNDQVVEFLGASIVGTYPFFKPLLLIVFVVSTILLELVIAGSISTAMSDPEAGAGRKCAMIVLGIGTATLCSLGAASIAFTPQKDIMNRLPGIAALGFSMSVHLGILFLGEWVLTGKHIIWNSIKEKTSARALGSLGANADRTDLAFSSEIRRLDQLIENARRTYPGYSYPPIFLTPPARASFMRISAGEVQPRSTSQTNGVPEESPTSNRAQSGPIADVWNDEAPAQTTERQRPDDNESNPIASAAEDVMERARREMDTSVRP